MDPKNDGGLVQRTVFRNENVSLGPQLEAVPAPQYSRFCPAKQAIRRKSLRFKIPPLVNYERWRIEKDDAGWAHATQTQVLAPQIELAEIASTSNNHAALAHIKWMGLDCLMQLNKVLMKKSGGNDGHWELAWMEMIRFNIGSNKQLDVGTFDVIIACTGLGDPTHISSHVSAEKSSTGQEMVRSDTVTDRTPDSSAKASVARSRLSPLAQLFVQIRTDEYEECLKFLLLNPAAVDEDHLQYLTEARLALDRGDEQLARSCLGKQMFVRDCKNERPQKYFDTLMKNQEGYQVFNNDLENALTRLKQAPRQDLGEKQPNTCVLDVKTQYKKELEDADALTSFTKLSQHEVKREQRRVVSSHIIEKRLRHENELLLRLTRDPEELRAEAQRKEALEKMLPVARHAYWKLWREKSKFEEVRGEEICEEACLKCQELNRDRAREKRIRRNGILPNDVRLNGARLNGTCLNGVLRKREKRQPCAKPGAESSKPKDNAHAHKDLIPSATQEKGKSQDIQSASGSDNEASPQRPEKSAVQSIEAEQPKHPRLSDQLPYQQDRVECSYTDHFGTLASHKSPRQEDDKVLVMECLAASTEVYVDVVQAVHEARDPKVWNKKHGEDDAVKPPEEHATSQKSSTVTVKASNSRQVGTKGVATVSSVQKTPCIEDFNFASQERATKTTTDASPRSILPRCKASHSRARASSWPNRPSERFVAEATEEDTHTDIECPEPGLEEENDLNNVELKTASTELEDVLAEEIEGYQIQQRELKTAEEKVRAREDEVAIEKAKIEEVKEQQRQIAVQLHEQKEAFTKAQQVQHQTFEEYQRNAETLVDRMQGALARIEEMEYQQLIPQLQPLQFEFMGGICGFGVNCSRYLFRRLYTWHKHRHALLP
jgi:hypothetical protein